MLTLEYDVRGVCVEAHNALGFLGALLVALAGNDFWRKTHLGLVFTGGEEGSVGGKGVEAQTCNARWWWW